MDCRNFRNDLESYLQGGLDFAGRFAIERHAEQCFVCGREKEEAEKLGRAAREIGRVSAPPDFEATLLARIHARDVAASPLARAWGFFQYRWDDLTWRRAALPAAGVAMLAVAGVGIALLVSRTPGAGSSTATAEAGPSGLETPASPVPAAMIESRLPSTPALHSTDPQADNGDYVEYTVPGPGNRQLIMRLPKTIRMRYAQQSEDYFIRNVSH